MRQTLFLLVIAALWLGACSYPHATTTVDDLTHGVREYLKQYEAPPAICCSGEETPNLIATYNEALAGAASGDARARRHAPTAVRRCLI